MSQLVQNTLMICGHEDQGEFGPWGIFVTSEDKVRLDRGWGSVWGLVREGNVGRRLVRPGRVEGCQGG